MKIIFITSKKYGKFEVFVDDEDYARLSLFKWSVKLDTTCINPTFYAVRTAPANKRIWMHKYICPNWKFVDHIDGNKLNNQKSNLRNITPSGNAQNQKKHADNTSGYKGVTWNKQRKKWVAQIYYNNKQLSLGGFLCKIEAAKVYDKNASEYFGKFARINNIQEGHACTMSCVCTIDTHE